MSDHHDDHPVHPIAGSIVVVVIAALFGLLFSLIAGSWTVPVVLIAVILAAWGVLNLLVLDDH
jgi:hypothetical protein